MKKQSKEYIAFEGQKFTIEWYFNDSGKSGALDYFETLDDEIQIKLLELMALIGTVGSIQNKQKFRHEGEKIYAFKP